MEQLARTPGLGHRRSDASKRYRFWRVGSYLIAYRVEKKTVHVVRVLHRGRDIRRFLGQSARHLRCSIGSSRQVSQKPLDVGRPQFPGSRHRP
jgi:hypothetical protein